MILQKELKYNGKSRGKSWTSDNEWTERACDEQERRVVVIRTISVSKFRILMIVGNNTPYAIFSRLTESNHI